MVQRKLLLEARERLRTSKVTRKNVKGETASTARIQPVCSMTPTDVILVDVSLNIDFNTPNFVTGTAMLDDENEIDPRFGSEFSPDRRQNASMTSKTDADESVLPTNRPKWKTKTPNRIVHVMGSVVEAEEDLR